MQGEDVAYRKDPEIGTSSSSSTLLGGRSVAGWIERSIFRCSDGCGTSGAVVREDRVMDGMVEWRLMVITVQENETRY
jgi:hypothetical protein